MASALVKQKNFDRQELTDPSFGSMATMKKLMILSASLIGAGLSLVEICSYIILFSHVWRHDNECAGFILDPKIIRNRNRANAISLTGTVNA